MPLRKVPNADATNPSTADRWEWAAILVLALFMAAIELAMGRIWWCEAGDWYPWSFDVWSRHNSQHLIDPYTLSHLEHGLGLYALLTWLCAARISEFARVMVSATVEAMWEIVENTDWMIQRYREATISLDYYGDSIANSLGDYAACLAGVWLARRLGLRTTAVLFVALEVVSVVWIRDSLLLNVLMLVSPVDAVRQWQLGS